MRVRADGKQFSLGDERFHFRGVTYGTFAPRDDGERFPERDQIKADFEMIADAGFTVVRTYTPAPEELLDLGSDWGLRFLNGIHWLDWRYLPGASRRQSRGLAREAVATVRREARRLAGREEVAALVLGNEIPADVVRWIGTERVAALIAELVEVARDADPDVLVTYATYPTTEYLPVPTVDFLTCNVFLEQQVDLRRYLTRLHHLAGDRPLVLGEIGLHAGGPDGEERQAEVLDWQLETAVERGVAGWCVFSWTDDWWVGDARVEGWQFGLTRRDRSPRQALDVASHWNEQTVADLDYPWPSMSIVICAYNAAATLDECLTHTCALEYPDLEVVVVDDGSTDATAEIAKRHPRARLVSIPHAGLSVARNAGMQAATGDLVVYLDSDAWPPPEWPWYIALAFDGPDVGAAGGPNVPPVDDPIGAQQVARAPGGPIHVLVADDRAEHVPGCNLAAWKKVLVEVSGFDPVYTAAGDDVDLCWKVLDRGWQIGFHPAALVWHHRRAGLRAYLRQQRGYGRSEALVEARHPDRFTAVGSARWRGRIYTSFAPRFRRQRVYRGLYGAAAYQSVYQGGGHALDLWHQVGIPAAAIAALTAPLALVSPLSATPALAAVVLVAVLGVIDAARAEPPRTVRHRRLRFRAGVALLHVLQPLVRTWGRVRHATLARRDLPPWTSLPGPVQRPSRRVLLLPLDRPRAEFAAAIVAAARRAGFRVVPPTGWEAHDATVHGSLLVSGRVVTSAHPEGCVQVRVRRRLRGVPTLAFVALVGVLGVTGRAGLVGASIVALAMAAEAVRGSWRTGPGLRRLVESMAA